METRTLYSQDKLFSLSVSERSQEETCLLFYVCRKTRNEFDFGDRALVTVNVNRNLCIIGVQSDLLVNHHNSQSRQYCERLKAKTGGSKDSHTLGGGSGERDTQVSVLQVHNKDLSLSLTRSVYTTTDRIGSLNPLVSLSIVLGKQLDQFCVNNTVTYNLEVLCQ